MVRTPRADQSYSLTLSVAASPTHSPTPTKRPLMIRGTSGRCNAGNCYWSKEVIKVMHPSWVKGSISSTGEGRALHAGHCGFQIIIGVLVRQSLLNISSPSKQQELTYGFNIPNHSRMK